MFIVYILRNKKGKHYVGHTNNIDDRIRRHNTNQVRSTKNKGPWAIIYTEESHSKQDAYKRELEIKSYKGGIKFKKLLEGCPSG